MITPRVTEEMMSMLNLGGWKQLLTHSRFDEYFLTNNLSDIMKYAPQELCQFQLLSPTMIRQIWDQVDPDLLCQYQSQIPDDLILAHYKDLVAPYDAIFRDLIRRKNPRYLKAIC